MLRRLYSGEGVQKRQEKRVSYAVATQFQCQCMDSSLMPVDSWYARLPTSQETKTDEADES